MQKCLVFAERTGSGLIVTVAQTEDMKLICLVPRSDKHCSLELCKLRCIKWKLHCVEMETVLDTLHRSGNYVV